MQTLSWELTTRLAKRRRARILVLRRGSGWLPFFFVRTALTLLANGVRGCIAIVHLGDPVLAPIGKLAKSLNIPVCVTVHGLDVTYPQRFYQWWLRQFFTNFDAYICISNAARNAAIARGAPAERTVVIGIGVTIPAIISRGRQPGSLLFVGRLVRRKGLEWFVRFVLPRVAAYRADARLAVIGRGPERKVIQAAALAAGVADRIDWLGAVPESEKQAWLQRASVCIVPNVHVPDDVEGYGIVALEAAAAGCPLVVADVDGLREAIAEGRGGLLVRSQDADAWTTAIVRFLDNPVDAATRGDRARQWAASERNWDTVCDGYERTFDAIAHRTVTF